MSSEATRLYRLMHAYLVQHDWQPVEEGSGWWWHETLQPDELVFGAAVQRQLRADGVDVRVRPVVVIEQDEPGRSGATGQGL